MKRLVSAARSAIVCLAMLCIFVLAAQGQTDCAEGGDSLDTTPPKAVPIEQLIQKLIANEEKAQAARSQYTFTQDLLVQTLDGKVADGQFHQVTKISYDDKGKRVENVTFSEQSTLHDVQMSDTDMDDVRNFMQWILSADQAAQYNLTYAGRQHVDDLDTYVFHAEPKKFEKNKRYFQGRFWVDDRDVQIVKLCGKSVPEAMVKKKKKKNESVEVRPTFVGYRQIVDGNWFPAYARVDETLNFGVHSVHVREIVKLTAYKRTAGTKTASSP
jgi:hypothetical protein